MGDTVKIGWVEAAKMFYNITSRFTYICIARGLCVRFTTYLQEQVAAFCQPAKDPRFKRGSFFIMTGTDLYRL